MRLVIFKVLQANGINLSSREVKAALDLVAKEMAYAKSLGGKTSKVMSRKKEQVDARYARLAEALKAKRAGQAADAAAAAATVAATLSAAQGKVEVEVEDDTMDKE